VEAGLVDLAEPLASTLPALDRPGVVPFGAWHVLSHTSGILDLDLEALVSAGADRAELLRAMLAQPQVTAPGSAYAYTSLTFDLLVEAVGLGLGRPFEEALHSRLLDPLGMADTVFDPRPAHAARMAPATVGGWDGIHRHDAGHDDRRLLETFISLRLGGAGLWSTADDLLRFGRAMLRRGELDGHRVLSPAFVELMTREVTTGGLGASPDPLEAEHYALGWGKPGVADPGSSAAFHHGGLTGTRLWIDPAHHLVYAYLTGAWGFDHRHIDAVGNAIYAALP
jgi:CubicO group peptidase (beta-lactamase class C family)